MSTATTWAPREAANTAFTPLPVPMSSTRRPDRLWAGTASPSRCEKRVTGITSGGTTMSKPR